MPVTGHGGPQGCERLWLPHYLDKWLIDGGKVIIFGCAANRKSQRLVSTPVPLMQNIPLHRGADKSLDFHICSTTKRIFL
jgi:hypothetical protein